jgi:hypothetical protein
MVFLEFYIRIFFENMPAKIRVSLKSDKKMGTLDADQYTLMSKIHSFALRMRNVSEKFCREIQNTHFYVR